MPSERIQRQIERLLDEAESALSEGNWDVARVRAEAVLRLDPANGDARSYVEAATNPSPTERSEEGASSVPPTQAAPTAPSQPESFANGRYTVKRFLGEGGKKRVYLAHDNTLDRDVAFALIKTEGLDDTSRQRITREAQAMGRLGDHPNIVPIFDLGAEDDPATGVRQPFMVLPLMTGGDVEGLIEKAPEHRLPLERTLQIARDTCEGLVFAHSKGIVHRDLKPGNVMVTERGVARIADFGLAVATDRSRLTREGFMVGTVSYMPPEQAMGGEITPRADLYSLGAMLYEMVTGRPPFMGDDDIAIIGQHINTPPVAPGWHRADCPKPLDALIMRLLAKDPSQRPDSASDVLSALKAVDLQSLPSPRSDRGEDEGEGANEGRSLDSMSSGVFVGRHKEMDQLRAVLEDALSGKGRMVALVGEPGIGKTRTSQELATYAGLRRCQVLWGRCYEGGGAPPYWPWVQAIRQYVQEREPDQIRKEMGSSASVIAEVVSEVRDRVPGLQSPPQLENPESARFRLFDSISTFLKNASRTQPILLVLDDLHWSDRPSLQLLEFVARELGNSRILVVGTYRDVEVNRRHPLAVTLGDLTKERLYERVLLRGIQKADVARFIEMASGVKPPEGLVDAVHIQTEGNPLFVTEVVRWLIQEKQLSPEKVAGKKSWSMPIPEGIRDVIGKRLDKLSPRCNDVLTTAAVIGRRFALPALVGLYSDQSLEAAERLSEDQLLSAVEEALASRVIEELASGPGRYQFSHALIQETLVDELSTTRRVRLHARIATELERLYGDRASERAAELAVHFAEAEAMLGPEKLLHYCLVAGTRALASHAHDEAVAQLTRGLSSVPQTGSERTRAELEAGLAAGHAGLRDIEKAMPHLISAFDYFVNAGDFTRAAEIARQPFVAAEGMIAMIPIREKALAKVPADSPQAGYILAAQSKAIGVFQHRYAEAVEHLGRAMAIAREREDFRLEFTANAAAVFVNFHNGERELSSQAARRVIELLSTVNDPLEGSFAYNTLATYAGLDGELDQSRRFSQLAIEAAMRARDRERLSTVHMVRCVIEANVGNWSLAREYGHTSLSYWDDARTLQILFLVELTIGNFEQSARHFQQLLSSPYRRGSLAQLRWWGVRLGGGRDRYGEVPDGSRSMFVPMEGRNLWSDLILAEEAAYAALLAGDQVMAAESLTQLTPLASSLARMTATGANHLLALLADLAGRPDDARTHFEQSAAALSRAKHRPWLAWVEFDYADSLLKASGRSDGSESAEADKARALALQEDALKIARDLGMKPLIEQIIARKKILKA